MTAKPSSSSPSFTVIIVSACAALSAIWLLGLIGLRTVGLGIGRHQFESAGLVFGALLLLAAALRIPARSSRASHDTHTARISNSPVTSALLVLAPASIAAMLFLWALPLGPLSDDYALQVWAQAHTFASADWTYFRPAPLVLWWLALKLGAGWPVLHAFNIACHCGTVALLTILGRKVFASPTAALTTGLSFALFPASIEAVGWTAGVFDSLMTLAVVAAATLFVVSDYARRTFLVAILAVFAIVAVLTKETAAVLPLLLLVLMPLARVAPETAQVAIGVGVRRYVLPLFASGTVLLAYLLVRSSFVGHSALPEVLSSLPHTRMQIKDMLVRPYAALAVPFHDSVSPWLSALAAVCLVLLFMATLLPRRDAGERAPAHAAIAAGLCWVLLAALPLLVNFYVGPDLQGSRYAYLPMAGFALALGGAVDALQGTPLRWLALATVCGLFSAWLLAWPSQVAPWRAAAAVRDTVLADAQRLAAARGCGSLRLHAAPDNVNGAYVFRVGLPEALRTLTFVPQGPPCVAAWRSGALTFVE
jgi:hypothetical protein